MCAKFNHICPLCDSKETTFFHSQKEREFNQCKNCELVFVLPEYFLSKSEEKSRYDKHQNTTDDSGYCDFLEQIVDPLNSYLKKGSQGLDFGCGPSATLSALMMKKGYQVANYDPFYHKDKELLKNEYDFITATEVVEHIAELNQTMHDLWKMIKQGGILAIMTSLIPYDIAFKDWYYIRDPTHIRFFSYKTIKWLSTRWNARCSICNNNVVLFFKD